MHAKARFRAFATTGLVTVGGSTLLAHQMGLPSGVALLKKFGPLSGAAVLGTFLVSYQIWER